jgi:hypothetical protein
MLVALASPAMSEGNWEGWSQRYWTQLPNNMPWRSSGTFNNGNGHFQASFTPYSSPDQTGYSRFASFSNGSPPPFMGRGILPPTGSSGPSYLNTQAFQSPQPLNNNYDNNNSNRPNNGNNNNLEPNSRTLSNDRDDLLKVYLKGIRGSG